MSSPELLTFEELVAPELAKGKVLHELYGDYAAILGPHDIPVHPLVYACRHVYTREFVDRVVSSVRDVLSEDIATIEHILGVDLGVKVDADGISDDIPYMVLPLDLKGPNALYLHVDEGVKVRLSRASAAVSLDRTKPVTTPYIPSLGMGHPMPDGKLKAYGAENTASFNLTTWYRHNALDQGAAVYHYFRAFAVQFNNLGLEKSV